MRKALLTVICMVMFCWIVPSVSVQAAEGWNYEYSYYFSGNSVIDLSIKSTCPIYGYISDEWGHVCFSAVTFDDGFFEYMVSGTEIYNGELNRIYNNSNFDIPVQSSSLWVDRLRNSPSNFGQSLNTNSSTVITFPLFESKEALANYLESSDESGWVNKPDVDYSVKHDFSKDVYDPEIPTPELSNLSYNGFSITNIDGYYLDLIVDYSLFGVKLENKGMGSYVPVVDEDWKYSSHYYNFTLDNKAFSNALLDINNTYGVDIEHDLIEDFKQWSLDYPMPSKLPSSTFWSHGSAVSMAYKLSNVYHVGSDKSDLQQLRESVQGIVYYYVRFYDKDGNNGQWVRYKYQPTESSKMDLIAIGSVKSDLLGNPLVDDEIKGSQNNETGELNYNSNYIGLDISDVNSFFSYIRVIFNNISSSLESFSSLISACFVFLPSEVIGLIIFGIVLMVFIGVVKAVIS